MVRPDRFWQLKVVRPNQKWSGVTNSALMSPRCVSWSFQVSQALVLAYLSVASYIAVGNYVCMRV